MTFFPATIRCSMRSLTLEKLITPIVKPQNILCMPVASVKTPPTYDVDDVPKFMSPIFTNRNPRNLEMLTIADKPIGYGLDKPKRMCWHRLEMDKSSRYVTTKVIHHSGRTVISASTNEWPLKKRLYSYSDKLAYETLGKVLAIRCLESGINSVFSVIEVQPGGKVESFFKALEEGGVYLSELKQYNDPSAMRKYRPDKPGEPEE